MSPEREIDFAQLAALLRGYEAERPLTTWERGHLYEAMCFGLGKHRIWALDSRAFSVPVDAGSAAAPWRRLESLRALGKSAFDAALEAAS